MRRSWIGRTLPLFGGTALILGTFTGPVQAQSAVTEINAAPVQSADASDVFADIPNLEVTYYDVAGNSAGAIRKAIDAARPRDPNDGTGVDAVARWQIGWRWPRAANGACDLAQAELRFSATILLPRLAEPHRVSKAVMARWDSYMAALKKHEATHIRTAWMNSGRVLDAIRASDCAGASDAGQAAIAALGQFDRQYDQATKHGRTEGAHFP